MIFIGRLKEVEEKGKEFGGIDFFFLKPKN